MSCKKYRLVFQYVQKKSHVCVDYNHYIDKVKNTFMNTTDVQHFFVLDSRLFCEWNWSDLYPFPQTLRQKKRFLFHLKSLAVLYYLNIIQQILKNLLWFNSFYLPGNLHYNTNKINFTFIHNYDFPNVFFIH